MTWQIFRVAVFWKTWPRSKGASRAVGFEEFRNGEGDESRRLVGVKIYGNYVFLLFFFEGKWLVIEILKCVVEF